MDTARSIARLGFRRWYERQLLESHAYLVTCLLCLIAVLAAAEELTAGARGFAAVLMAALIAAGFLIGAIACWRYLAMLACAEHVSDRSICGQCKARAAYSVVHAPAEQGGTSATLPASTFEPFAVRCRKCGHQWTIR